jgi:hypothetical protein
MIYMFVFSFRDMCEIINFRAGKKERFRKS